MFGRIRDLFHPGGDPAERLRRAAAALLVEAARLDGAVGEGERARILALLQRHFGVDAEEAGNLLAAAAAAAADAVDLFAFTRVINESFAPEERVTVIEMLWEVAYADGQLDDFEANLIRRVGGLLFVPDRETGEARKRALARLGLDADLARQNCGD